MKRNKIIIGLFATILGMTSCDSNKSKENEESNSEPTIEATTSQKEAPINTEDIDKLRSEIEALQISPIEISTADLREKTKQKWSNIHFYVQNDKVVKVKTYPHAQVSKRTEEFYANEDGLALVVIEDNGEGPKGKDKNGINKLYYFHNGKLIKEQKNEKESEYTIKDSDAEELISEFNEYLETYKQTKK